MADILWSVVLPNIVECACDMKRHISYVFNCKRNINKLKEAVEALDDVQKMMQHFVEDERRNGKLIQWPVAEWLGKVGVILEKEGRELELLASGKTEMKCFFGFCPNLKTRYRVSRKAGEEARELAKLLERGQGFGRIAYASRMAVSEHIIKVLTTYGVRMVGVHGIGGVGKTTLAKEILRQVKEQKLFDEAVLVTVTKEVNVKDIQAEIGEALGLKFDGVESVKVRASRLFGRLELDKEKKVLIILDELWKKLDLVEVGIPSKNQLSGCKMLLTSRDLKVLSNEMECQENFEIGCLPEKEAWDLFRKMANNSFEQQDLRSTAIEVAKVHAGLPISIVTVARTLVGKKLPEWKAALLKLKNIDLYTGLTPMQATIYSTLEFSYQDLDSELQSTFLICCQMGYNATTEDLLKYSIGLGLFNNILTLEEAQNRLYSSVQWLRVLCFLLEGGANKELIMNDVVRDFISSAYSNKKNITI